MSQGVARVVAGRYTLVRPLGRGGMGVVWQARDGLLHRDVAIKEISFPATGDDAAEPLMRRALREAQAAAQLRHPGIITVHDVVTEDGRPWIVMELIGGRSLAEVIRAQGLLSPWRTAEIGLRVLEALRAAHRHGILHRDVKPANILLDEDRVVLTDFGIAAVDGATVLTATGQMVGSPSYLAPERINGRPATSAADLWALGVTLYASVTGRPPFHGEDTQATLAAILTSRPQPPAHAGQLWPVLKGLLVKDADQRLTADQAAPLLAVAAQPPDTPKPPRRRRRFTPDTIAGTLVAPPPTLAAPTDLQPVPDVKHPPDTNQPVRPTPSAAGTVAAGTVAEETVAAGTVAELPAPRPGTDPQVTAVPVSPTRPATSGRQLAGAAAAVAGIIAVTATVVHLATPGGEGAEPRAAPSPPGAVSPSAPVSPSPSYPPGIDPCLLGTWRVTMNRVWGLIGDTRVLYTGGSGVIVSYRADGTSRTDYSKMRPRTTRYRGATWSDVHRGSVSSRYNADDGIITDIITRSNAIDTLRRNGRIDVRAPVTFFPEPSHYRCTAKDLYTYSAQGNDSVQLVRVSKPPS